MARAQASAVEFLTQVLSKRGTAEELPYTEDVKWTVRQHLLDLHQEFPTLMIKVQTYTHTNGRSVPLLMVEGTLPMYYQGVKYNIPVSAWLPEAYPRAPPIFYVVPTPDMIIKPRHSFVDASGIVASPYIQNWVFPRANLVDMCTDTSIQFGQDPPLFSKPKGWTLPPPVSHASPSHAARPAQPPPAQQPATSGNANVFHAENPMIRPTPPYGSASPYGSTSPYGVNPYGQQSSSAYPQSSPADQSGGNLWGAAVAASQGTSSSMHSAAQQPPTPPAKPPPPSVDLNEVFRQTAIAALTERLQTTLASLNSQAASEMDALLETQNELSRRRGQIEQGIASMQQEKVALESTVLEMHGKSVAMERWLAENEAKNPEGEVDADAAIVPADILSRQALDAQAQDMAIEDGLYALDKALQNGSISAEVYLKQVRSLCRKQFFVRALGMKVANRQHEARRAFAPHRSAPQPPSHVQMPQGDSWANTGILANPLTAHR
ncbi:hypothetical protein WJX72_008931 [[Myrmecia] bisecta]|uniref:Uncharacterized protein n=1 Tax=[Myrmecia] bisecta TaxID=41462 RepID=A0AAW1PXG9_9CHLO